MKRIIRAASQVGYQKVAKPIMFKRQPDAVHSDIVKAAKRMQKTPGVRRLPKLWAHKNHTMLQQTIAGVTFANPIGLSAGFDKTIEMPVLMKNLGFGWMTGGSVTLGHYDGNEKPWYHRLPRSKSLVVNAGLPSEGTPVVVDRVSRYDTSLFKEFPLIISVAKTNSHDCANDTAAIEDYCQSLAAFSKLPQVNMLEINISCPNTFGGEPFTTPKRLSALLAHVDALGLKKPIFIKMPIGLEVSEFDDLLRVMAHHSVAGVTIGNLMKDRAKARLKDDISSEIKGNLSGAPNKEVATELVRHTYQKYGDRFIIIGVGGVFSAQDAYEKIKAGASLVALITGMVFEGPQLIGEINYGLEKLIKQDGFDTIAEAIGSAHAKKSV